MNVIVEAKKSNDKVSYKDNSKFSNIYILLNLVMILGKMEQTYTMMVDEETPEVGPNDIVIHLVNPYKCGMCELEFLDKNVFKVLFFNIFFKTF